MATKRDSTDLSDQSVVANNDSRLFTQNNRSDQAQESKTQTPQNPIMKEKQKTLKPNVERHRFRRYKLGFLKPWWMEITACVLILLAIMAIVLILALYQNQPLPNWPFGISVNSLVSIFAVILKGGMLLILGEGISQAKWMWFRNPRPLGHFSLFYEGSQGPLGAATLLWTLRGREIAASSAALITIVALAIDPFTQQIIDYHSQQLPSSGQQAGISRTNNFTQSGDIQTGLPITGPLYNGFFSSGQAGASNPSFNCPTGNCTFDPYYTVGICSECNDITSQVEVSKNCDVCRIPNSGYQGDSCTQSLPDANLNITQCDYDGNLFASSIDFPSDYVSSLPSPFNLCFNGAYFQAMMYSASQKGCLGPATSYLSNDGGCLRAVECGLYPCVRGYNGEVKSSNFTERLVSAGPMPLASASFTVDDPFCFYALHLGCVNTAGMNLLRAQGYSITNGQEWLQYNCSSRVENAMTIPDQCIYEFSYYSSKALSINFEFGFFNGSLQNAYIGSVDGATGPAQLQVLFDNGANTLESIQTTMARVADFLTSYIRENGDASNSASAPGTVFQNETIVHVRWAWFTLPAALALFTLIFLGYTLVATARNGRQTNWKSSPLALLFHGLDAQTQDKYSLLDDLEEMDKKAKEATVQLRKDGQGGWRLRTVGK